MRPLSNEELELIRRFAEKLSAVEQAQLLNDASHAAVMRELDDGSRIVFDISDYSRPPYHGQHSIGVEGRVLDMDNVDVSVCIYADENGRLFELEFIRWAAGKLLGPRWNTLQLYGSR